MEWYRSFPWMKSKAICSWGMSLFKWETEIEFVSRLPEHNYYLCRYLPFAIFSAYHPRLCQEANWGKGQRYLCVFAEKSIIQRNWVKHNEWIDLTGWLDGVRPEGRKQVRKLLSSYSFIYSHDWNSIISSQLVHFLSIFFHFHALPVFALQLRKHFL